MQPQLQLSGNISKTESYELTSTVKSTDFLISTTELPHQELTQTVSHIPVQEVSRKATVKTVTE